MSTPCDDIQVEKKNSSDDRQTAAVSFFLSLVCLSLEHFSINILIINSTADRETSRNKFFNKYYLVQTKEEAEEEKQKIFFMEF